MRTTAQILRDYRGPALVSFGFRPFFLLAGLLAALAVPVWLWAWWTGAALSSDWHGHEMLFGYAGAVIAGYMIVAGANWTGHYPVAGWPVAALAALWLAGRAAMPLGGWAEAVDAAFLPLFAALLWREQLAAANWRSLAPCLVVSALALADLGFHLRGVRPGLGEAALRAGIALVAFLIALMGGRLVPSFTRNWLARHRITPEPAPQSALDRAALALAGAGLAAWVAAPESRAAGVLLVAGGTGLALRLARWRGRAAAREGMVAILHLGYAWCALGVAALGASVLWPVPQTAALHALTAGAIGVMTLAMMTRTARSHTGRARQADPPTLAIYALVNLAALARVAASLAGSQALMLASAICWTGAFALFVAVYGPILAGPARKPRRKAG